MMDAMSDEDDIHVPGLPRKRAAKKRAESSAPPSTTSVVAISASTAVIATLAVVFAMGRVRPEMLASSASAVAVAPSSRAVEASSAAVAQEVIVPDLARIPAENVRAIVEAMGLRAIVNERREPSAVPDGLVAAQAPRAGSRVARGGDVAVVISSGPAQTAAQPTPQPVVVASAGAVTNSDGVVVVPSVYRLHEPQARGRLSAAGLVVGAHRRASYDEDVAPGRILRQSPAAGARVARGTAVDIWVNEE